MATSTCPICRHPLKAGLATPTHPFCGPRCKLVDLGNWLDDRYAIPSESTAELEAMSDEELAALLQEPS